MKMLLTSIFDKATEAYMRPFTAQTVGQAVRLFQDECTRQGSECNKHPEDYALFHVGNFSDHNGELEAIEPKCLARAHELVAHSKNDQTIPTLEQVQK